MNLLLIFIGLFIWLTLLSMMTQLKKDCARIHWTLNKISQKINVDDTLSKALDDELRDLILQGKHIQAVKQYRMVTGADLLEANRHVNKLYETLK